MKFNVDSALMPTRICELNATSSLRCFESCYSLHPDSKDWLANHNEKISADGAGWSASITLSGLLLQLSNVENGRDTKAP